MYYSYDAFLRRIKELGAQVDGWEASCPKHMNAICLKESKRCECGNKRNCSQVLSFFLNGALFFVRVIFVYKPNTSEGFVVSNSAAIRRLISSGAMKTSDFVAMS